MKLVAWFGAHYAFERPNKNRDLYIIRIPLHHRIIRRMRITSVLANVKLILGVSLRGVALALFFKPHILLALLQVLAGISL